MVYYIPLPNIFSSKVILMQFNGINSLLANSIILTGILLNEFIVWSHEHSLYGNAQMMDKWVSKCKKKTETIVHGYLLLVQMKVVSRNDIVIGVAMLMGWWWCISGRLAEMDDDARFFGNYLNSIKLVIHSLAWLVHPFSILSACILACLG